ncbi:MAG: hypothetical protein KDI06_07505 [Calditrichaeota bacterium]|nr:hypothetical protein [Calditrichota bacterium]HQU72223.1 hypothetical protein [Calditrichia bacterium]
MNTFWIALLIIVLVGHVVWFIIYAIRVMKNDEVKITRPDSPKSEEPGRD